MSSADRASAIEGKTRKTTATVTDNEIYDEIVGAIADHALPPGTKLGEDRLGEVFGVSRTRIRQVLIRLAHARLVTLEPNRGAFVARPTVRETREMFDARRIIEPALVARLAGTLSAAQARKLRSHVEKEQAARASDDRPRIVRLSGEFHLLLAEMAGNQTLAGMLADLMSRNSLIVMLYGSSMISSCPYNEHDALIDALERGDGAGASAIMHHHLEHVEQSLVLDSDGARAVDLRTVFRRSAD